MASNELIKRKVPEGEINIDTSKFRNYNNLQEEEAASQFATQNNLFGPITGQLLIDPVIIQDEPERAYERQDIEKWLRDNDTSPLTRKRGVTVADLKPDIDKQKKIREFVRRYPNAQIVREWLQMQPSWYTPIFNRIRNTPSVLEMSRLARHGTREARATCSRCCNDVRRSRWKGAIIGGLCGGLTGCVCGMAAVPPDMATVAAATERGASVGAIMGATLGDEGCTRCVGKACNLLTECAAGGTNVGRGGKRKTRKSKKKRRKTRKRKRKKTVKRKRKKKRKKTRGKRKK